MKTYREEQIEKYNEISRQELLPYKQYRKILLIEIKNHISQNYTNKELEKILEVVGMWEELTMKPWK